MIMLNPEPDFWIHAVRQLSTYRRILTLRLLVDRACKDIAVTCV